MANTTDQQYYNHLLDIKEKMEDFLSKVDNGKKTYLIDLALKMRILLIRKSGTNPLFQSIMEKFNFRLNVFFKESMIESIKNGSLPSSLLDKMIISYSNNAMNWFDENSPSKEMLNIVEAFNKEDQIQVGKYSFSFKKIIETVADQMGGAHIDKKVKDSDLILHSNDFLFGNLNVAERVIYDTSRKCIQAIEEIERYIESNNESTFIEAV